MIRYRRASRSTPSPQRQAREIRNAPPRNDRAHANMRASVPAYPTERPFVSVFESPMKKISIIVVYFLLLQSEGVVFAADSFLNWGRFKSQYIERRPEPVYFGNSPLLHQLLRGGNIYLSLPDAIELAIQNNLDIEIQRYGLPSATADLNRAKGGGILRGLAYSVTEAATGVGGPASPLVTSQASSTFAVGSV